MNYLEHPDLQPGVIWGLGRLAHARPGLADDAAGFLGPYLEATDPLLRGLAAWTAGALPLESNRQRLQALAGDRCTIRLYRDNRMEEVRIDQLAAECLQKEPR